MASLGHNELRKKTPQTGDTDLLLLARDIYGQRHTCLICVSLCRTVGDKQAFSINHKCFLVDPKLVLQNNDKTSAFDTLSKNSVFFSLLSRF